MVYRYQRDVPAWRWENSGADYRVNTKTLTSATLMLERLARTKLT